MTTKVSGNLINTGTITSVGELSNLSVTGNVTAAQFIGNGSQMSGVINSTSPIFSAYATDSGQTLAAGSTSVIAMQNKQFDTAGCFNNTGANVTLNGVVVPAYAFLPTVPGYYYFTAAVRKPASTGEICVQLSKNTVTAFIGSNPSANAFSSHTSGMIYLNGTSDYVRAYAFTSAAVSVVGRTTTTGGTTYPLDTYFQGHLVCPG